MKILLLIILYSISFLYFPLNRQTPKYCFRTKVDSQIPVLPWTVWVYLSYFILFPLSIALVWNSRYAVPLLTTQIIATSVATIIWKIFPNGVSRPIIQSDYNTNHRFLAYIFNHDKDCNGLPSGHIIHSFVSCFFLAQRFPTYWFIFPAILLCISLSTLTTKQHYFIDMVFTLLATPIIIELSGYLL